MRRNAPGHVTARSPALAAAPRPRGRMAGRTGTAALRSKFKLASVQGQERWPWESEQYGVPQKIMYTRTRDGYGR